MNSKIVTRTSQSSWMGKYGEKRMHVNETAVVWRYGFMIPYFNLWIGFMKLGPKKTRGILEDEF
uniref:Uncharacterized protein n=1 Tax=Ochrobactrum phage ORM_20 TaxID=2985243 RepID=A0A9N6ZGA6_9VIRU|nr:hypothetical protein ORM20_00128 [Ochrobactrum phage ORM_20]